MRTDGQTEMTKVVVVLRNFLNAHKIAVCSQIHTKHINTAVWAERGIFYC
jgi:hypothetical protein